MLRAAAGGASLHSSLSGECSRHPFNSDSFHLMGIITAHFCSGRQSGEICKIMCKVTAEMRHNRYISSILTLCCCCCCRSRSVPSFRRNMVKINFLRLFWKLICRRAYCVRLPGEWRGGEAPPDTPWPHAPARLAVCLASLAGNVLVWLSCCWSCFVSSVFLVSLVVITGHASPDRHNSCRNNKLTTL